MSMASQARDSLSKLYKNLSREVSLSVLDDNTKNILSNDYSRLSKSIIDSIDESRMHNLNRLITKHGKDLKSIQRVNLVGKEIKPDEISKKHRSNYINSLISLYKRAYIEVIPLADRSPYWLSKFVASDKKTLLRDYSGLVKVKHEIYKLQNNDKSKNSNIAEVIDHYNAVLERKQFEKLNSSLLYSLGREKIKAADLSKKSTNHLKGIVPSHVTDDIKKLKTLYEKMQHLVDLKKGYPQFEISLYPTALGLPREIPVQENKVIKELKKFQGILRNYSLIESQDLEYLESLYYNIPKSEMQNRMVSIAVKSFLKETVSVNDDASLRASKTMFRYNEPIGDLTSLYEIVKQYSSDLSS